MGSGCTCMRTQARCHCVLFLRPSRPLAVACSAMRWGSASRCRFDLAPPTLQTLAHPSIAATATAPLPMSLSGDRLRAGATGTRGLGHAAPAPLDEYERASYQGFSARRPRGAAAPMGGRGGEAHTERGTEGLHLRWTRRRLSAGASAASAAACTRWWPRRGRRGRRDWEALQARSRQREAV